MLEVPRRRQDLDDRARAAPFADQLSRLHERLVLEGPVEVVDAHLLEPARGRSLNILRKYASGRRRTTSVMVSHVRANSANLTRPTGVDIFFSEITRCFFHAFLRQRAAGT